ncbi:MAG: tetratricopeptide repeat protein [Kiritimatiellia bacterium]|jgi:tetratricopeptide (TPR) repeat protein
MNVKHLAAAALAALAIACGGCSGAKSSANTADAAIAEGWEYFEASEYSLALAGFLRAEELAGDDATLQEAKFAQGLIWHVRTRPDNNPAKAREAYRKAIEIDPRSELAAWADLWCARIASEVDRGEYPPAADRLAAYQGVVERYPDHPAGEEAFLCVEAIKLEEDTPEIARTVRAELEDFLATHPDSDWRQTAYGLLVHCDDLLDDLDALYDHSRKGWEARYVNPADPEADPTLIHWKLALIAEFDVGDLEAAVAHYRAFIDRYPNHQRTFLALQELERLEAVLGIETEEQTPVSSEEDGHGQE